MTGVSQATVSLVLNGPRRRRRAHRAGDPRAGAAGDPPRPATWPTRSPGGWPPGTTASSACSPTSRCSRAAAATSTTRSWSASRSGPSALGCDLLLFTSAPVVDGRRRIFHERQPAAARRRLRPARSLARPRRAGPAASPRSTRSSRSAGATTRAARCPMSAPTTRRPPPRSCGARSALGHDRLAYVGPGRGRRVAGRPHARLPGGRSPRPGSTGHARAASPTPASCSTRCCATGSRRSFVEELADGVALVAPRRSARLRVPDDLSRRGPRATRPGRPRPTSTSPASASRAGRWAEQAVEVLTALIEGRRTTDAQRLLPLRARCAGDARSPDERTS